MKANVNKIAKVIDLIDKVYDKTAFNHELPDMVSDNLAGAIELLQELLLEELEPPEPLTNGKLEELYTSFKKWWPEHSNYKNASYRFLQNKKKSPPEYVPEFLWCFMGYVASFEARSREEI